MLDRNVARALLRAMGANEDEMEEKIDELFPEPVEREEPKDFIYLEMALENPVWMLVYADDPEREVDVRMSYEDLMTIYERMSKR